MRKNWKILVAAVLPLCLFSMFSLSVGAEAGPVNRPGMLPETTDGTGGGSGESTGETPEAYFSLTYDANCPDAVEVPPADSILSGDKAVLSGASPVRDGYQFTGWNTSSDGSGTAYLPSAEIFLEGNLTLYAQWEEAPAAASDDAERTFGYLDLPADNNVTSSTQQQDSSLSYQALSLPASFIPDYSTLMKIRNQGQYGVCWAFASEALAELSTVRQGSLSTAVDLSELQLVYFSVYSNLNSSSSEATGDTVTYIGKDSSGNSISFMQHGGNYIIALQSLLNWSGAVNESDVPYSSTEQVVSSGLDSKYQYDYDSVHVQDVYQLSLSGDTDLVKQYIQQYGGVGLSYHYNSDCESDDGTAYFNGDNQIQYGHAVVIVGWDDAYSKTNFQNSPYYRSFSSTSTGKQAPDKDGAWLIRNSWGPYSGDQGYFWLSYEDASTNDAVYAVKAEPADNYDHNYQYDGNNWFGCGTYIGGQNGTATAANMFTSTCTDTTQTESLKAVSFETDLGTVNAAYTVRIYKNPKDLSNPESGELMTAATTTGTTTAAGAYTVELAEPVLLNKGDQFAAVVTLTRSDSGSVDFAAEYPTLDSMGEYLKFVTTAAAHQSYVKVNGQWTDYGQEHNENIRIKAFTKHIVPLTGIQIGCQNLKMIRNQTQALKISYSPEDTTMRDVQWASSNSQIVAVDAAGNLKAVGLGTATITVTGANQLSDSIQLTVYEGDIGSAVITRPDSVVYNGQVQPFSLFTVAFNRKTLVLNQDYQIAYAADKGTDAGTVGYTVTGTGNYTGTVTGSFRITPKTLETSMVSYGDLFVTGSEVRPVSIRCLNRQLSEGTDYDIAYQNNQEPGQASAVINGKGNYSGKLSVAFRLYRRLTALHISGDQQISLPAGQSVQLQTEFTPDSGADQELVWTSSDTGIAQVDANGLLHGLKAGQATIRAASKRQPEITASIEVAVSPVISRLAFAGGSTSLQKQLTLGGDEEIRAAAVTSDGGDGNAYVAWNSTKPEVVEVTADAEEHGKAVLHPVAVGTSQVTASAGGRVITAMVTVYSVDPAAKLSIAMNSADPGAGIELGDSDQILVKADERTITDLMNFTSSNTSVATVSASGNVEVIGAGTASITAAIKDDPAARKVSLTVKGVLPAAASVAITVPATPGYTADADTIEADWADLGTRESRILNLNTTTLKKNGTAFSGAKIAWKSSDSSVVSISSKGVATIRKAGEAVLTAAVQDASNKSASIAVIIKDYAPVLENGTAVLNRNMNTGTPLGIHEAYGNPVNSITVYEISRGTETVSTHFAVTGSGENWNLGITQIPAAGSYKVRYEFATGRRQYSYTGTVRVVNTLPAVTVKYAGKVNSFLKRNRMQLVLSNPGIEVEAVHLEGSEAFLNNFPGIDRDGNVQVAEVLRLENGRIANTGELHIRYRGYAADKVVKVSIPCTNAKPSYRLSQSSVSVYEGAEKKIHLTLLDPTSRQPVSLSGMGVTVSGDGFSGGIAGDEIVLTAQKSGKAVLVLSNEDAWTDSISCSVTVNTVKAVSMSLKGNARLNRRIPGEKAVLSAVIGSSVTNLKMTGAEVRWNLNTRLGQSSDDIGYAVADGNLIFTLNAGARAGTYSGTVVPVLKDDSGTEVQLSKGIPVKVTVLDKDPTVTIRASGALNPIDPDAKAVLKTAVQNLNDTVASAALVDDQGNAVPGLKAEVDSSTQAVIVTRAEGAVPAAKTDVKVKLTFADTGYVYTVPGAVSILCRQTLPVVKATGNSMKMYNRWGGDRKIGTAVLNISGFGGSIESIEPLYTSGNRWMADAFQMELTADADGNKGITVSLKDAGRMKVNGTVTVKIRLHYAGETLSSSYSSVSITVADRSSAIRAVTR